VARLRSGASFDDVAAAFGDPQVAPVPDVLLPPAKLREYVGPSALVVAEALAVGGVSDPIATQHGVRVLLLVAREDADPPRLEAIETEVRNEMTRRAGDLAVRRLLAELRANAWLEIADPLQ
jgi:parvulin-like peptidyl-prolyl isomerase